MIHAVKAVKMRFLAGFEEAIGEHGEGNGMRRSS